MMATQTDLEGIVECIVARENPERIYLFGSYAKNTAHSSSDIDLLIIQPSRLPRRHRGRAAGAMLSTFPKRFHLVFYTPQELAEELRDPFSFVSKVIPTAKLVFLSATGSPPEGTAQGVNHHPAAKLGLGNVSTSPPPSASSSVDRSAARPSLARSSTP